MSSGLVSEVLLDHFSNVQNIVLHKVTKYWFDCLQLPIMRILKPTNNVNTVVWLQLEIFCNVINYDGFAKITS